MLKSRYLITLIAVPVLFFSAKAYSKNINESNTSEPKRQKAYLVVDQKASGQRIEVNGFSEGRSLQKIIDDLQLMIYPEDKISLFPDIYLEMGGVISINRAPKINLYDGKKLQVIRSWQGTIEELFREREIVLGMEDKVSLPLDSAISDNMEIKISRVAKTVIIESEEIAFKKLHKDDPDLKYGKTRLEEGSAGKRELKYLVTRIDGEEVSRTLLENKTIIEAKDEITYTGAKIVVLSSERGFATITTVPNYIVSANYAKGTLIRITNKANGRSIIVTVNDTWGTARPPQDVVLDLSMSYMNQLGWNGSGKGPYVSVEEIEQ